MPPFEPLSIGGTEPLHSFFQIRPPGSNEQVVMIIRKHLRKYVDAEPLRHLADSV
jgi:hypothetical protein